MRYLIALLMGLTLGAYPASGGIFGRRSCGSSCGHVVAPVSQNDTTNIIFNNLYPSTFPLAQGGQSVYGLQSAAGPYGDSPALLLDRSARFAEMSLELGKTATEAFNETGRLALELNDAADRRHHNATIAALAMEANRGTTQQTLAIQITDGKMSIVQPQALTQAGGPAEPITALTCANCHTGDKAPKGIILDGSQPFDLEKAMAAVISGKMPPKSSLTPAQKAAVAKGLCEVQSQTGDLK